MTDLNRLVEVTMMKPANVLVPMALAFLLAPGNFVTMPGRTGMLDVTTFAPNRTVILTHAVVLGAALAILRYKYPMFY